MVSECILCVLGFPMTYRACSNDSYSLLYMYIYSYFETWLVTGLFLGMSSNDKALEGCTAMIARIPEQVIRKKKSRG